MMLLDYFGVFGRIFGKRDGISKSRQFRGPTLRRRSTPMHGMSTPWCGCEGGLDKPQVRRGVAKLCRGEGLRRSVALFTDVFLSCFDIPLFRGLVYWTNEDPISV